MKQETHLSFIPVILGGDITAYSLARSFYEAYRTKSIVISHAKTGMTHSAFMHNVIEPQMETEHVFLSVLDRIAGQHPDQKLILLACGDWYVTKIIKNKSRLGHNYVIPYIDLPLFETLVLKDKFYAICDELGIDHPRTAIYDLSKPEAPPFDFPFPVIAKPANSSMYHDAQFEGKRKVFRFDTPQELENMMERLRQSSYTDKFLIQDCIPGDDTHMRILTCYSDQNARVKFVAFGRVLLEDHGPNAIGNPVAIINDVQMEVAAQAIRFLEHTGYTGFSNFDLKWDVRNQTYNFFEINPRLGRSNYYVTASGFNVVRWIVEDLIYQKELPFTVADKRHLYTVVPRRVLQDYLQGNAPLRAEVEELYQAGKVTNPFYTWQDRNLIHQLYYYRFAMLQGKKYDRYKDAVVSVPVETTPTPPPHGIVPPHQNRPVAGVLSGMGPMTTATFVELVVNLTDAPTDQDHLELLIKHHPQIPDRTAYILDPTADNPLPVLIADAQQLARSGATYLVLPCNTAHYFYQALSESVNIPCLNMIEETMLFAKEQEQALQTVGILSTQGTLKAGIYQEIAKQHGVDCILPTEEETVALMAVIYGQVKASQPAELSALTAMMTRMMMAGAQRIILGCTELSIVREQLVAQGAVTAEQLLDPLEILARKTILAGGKTIRAVTPSGEPHSTQ